MYHLEVKEMRRNHLGSMVVFLFLGLCVYVQPLGLTAQDESQVATPKPSFTAVVENGERLFVDNLQLYQSLTPSQKAEALSHLGIQKQQLLGSLKAGNPFPGNQGAMSVQVIPSASDERDKPSVKSGGGGAAAGSSTTYYGYGHQPFNVTAGPTYSTNIPCVTILGVKICSGTASAGAVYNASSGLIVEATAALGVASIGASASLGAEYVSQVPAGLTSNVTVTATVYTWDGTVGVSGVGASCAPLYMNESDPSGSHSDTLASCLDTLSISVPVIEVSEAASAALQIYGNLSFLLDKYESIIDLLSDIPQYGTTPFHWSGRLSHGSGLEIAVTPDTQARDLGAGTVFNESSSIVVIEVSESWQ